ncbi:DinB family protein [Chloroflexota bacterium]
MSNREDTIARYADGPNQLETAIAGLSEGDLGIAESDSNWTIRQIVHHVVDGDDIWKVFIKRAIGNPGSKFDLQWYWEVPQNEWVKRWAYASRDIEPSLALFRANRGHIVQLLENMPAVWERSLLVRWPNDEEEEVSVAWVVKMQAQHVPGHMDDIQRARQVHGV